jgi:hypothetical protein
MNIFGFSLLIWSGLIGMLFLILTVIFVKLQGKVKAFAGLHQKFAPVAVLFALIHFTLAILSVFFGIRV